MIKYGSGEFLDRVIEMMKTAGPDVSRVVVDHSLGLAFEIRHYEEYNGENREALIDEMAHEYIGLAVLLLGYKIDPKELEERINYLLGEGTVK